jgi:FkbM family methyltransferase
MKPKFIRLLINSYYSLFQNLDLFEVCSKRSINIDWVLEAGCHDGTDTVLLNAQFKPARYLAFEPDSAARLKAEMTLGSIEITNVEIYPYGLSNLNTTVYLKYEASGKGSGSTHFSPTGEDSVQIHRFDDSHQIDQASGLLWLDVEGHARQALEGMHKALQRIVVGRIECQLHSRNLDFQKDFQQVVLLMKQNSLLPVYGPIYPGYFGDIVFIRKSYMSHLDLIRSKILFAQMLFLHNFLFPILHKPVQNHEPGMRV